MQVLDLDPHAVRGLARDHGAHRSSLADAEEGLAGVGEERPERRAVEDDVRGRAADSGRWRRSPPERGGGRPAKGGKGTAAVVRRRRGRGEATRADGWRRAMGLGGPVWASRAGGGEVGAGHLALADWTEAAAGFVLWRGGRVRWRRGNFLGLETRGSEIWNEGSIYRHRGS